MDSYKRITPFLIVALVSFALGGVILLTVLRVGQEKPIAPTAPEPQRAVGGVPVPACQVSFSVSVASPTPTPSPTPRVTPSPTPRPTPSPTPRATPSPTPRVTPSPTPRATPSPTPRPTPSPTPLPSATPRPSPAPICLDLRVYRVVNSQWIPVDFVNDPPLPGETIYLAVLGGSTIGDYTEARFRIYANGLLQPGDNGNPDGWRYTTARNANGEFYIPYTLSVLTTTNFSVGAEVFFPGFGWL